MEHKHREGEVITNPLDPEHPYPLYPQQQEISQLQERIQQRRFYNRSDDTVSLRLHPPNSGIAQMYHIVMFKCSY